jgi:hypothetical protein
MNVIEEHRNCTSYTGHEVQHLTPKGWQACSVIFKTEEEATTRMTLIERIGTQFRVHSTVERRKS